ncbi:hypothetical protein Bbelb_341810 [Branchiostoma belcheri]|nr:hypothetical protein Bbelb_341810 [Branchiostoma belcheri]
MDSRQRRTGDRQQTEEDRRQVGDRRDTIDSRQRRKGDRWGIEETQRTGDRSRVMLSRLHLLKGVQQAMHNGLSLLEIQPLAQIPSPAHALPAIRWAPGARRSDTGYASPLGPAASTIWGSDLSLPVKLVESAYLRGLRIQYQSAVYRVCAPGAQRTAGRACAGNGPPKARARVLKRRRDLIVRTPRGTPPVAGSPPGQICYVTDQINRIKPMRSRLLSPTGTGRGYIPDGHRRNGDRSIRRPYGSLFRRKNSWIFYIYIPEIPQGLNCEELTIMCSVNLERLPFGANSGDFNTTPGRTRPAHLGWAFSESVCRGKGLCVGDVIPKAVDSCNGKMGNNGSTPSTPAKLPVIDGTRFRKYDFPFENLVMEGGGVKGLAHLGAVKILDDAGILEKIKRFGGTSAGAVAGGLLVIGMTPKEILDKVNENLQDVAIGASIATRTVSIGLVLCLDGLGFGSGTALDSHRVSKNVDFAQAFRVCVDYLEPCLRKVLPKFAKDLVDYHWYFKNLKEDFGMLPGEAFLDWYGKTMEEHLQTVKQEKEKKGENVDKLDRNINFEQASPPQCDGRWLAVISKQPYGGKVFEVFKKELCTVSYEPEFSSEVYSHLKTSPLLEIKKAVRMSMSIPVLFEAYKPSSNPLIQARHVDGGFSANYPIYCFEANTFEQKLRGANQDNNFLPGVSREHFDVKGSNEQQEEIRKKTIGLHLNGTQPDCPEPCPEVLSIIVIGGTRHGLGQDHRVSRTVLSPQARFGTHTERPNHVHYRIQGAYQDEFEKRTADYLKKHPEDEKYLQKPNTALANAFDKKQSRLRKEQAQFAKECEEVSKLYRGKIKDVVNAFPDEAKMKSLFNQLTDDEVKIINNGDANVTKEAAFNRLFHDYKGELTTTVATNIFENQVPLDTAKNSCLKGNFADSSMELKRGGGVASTHVTRTSLARHSHGCARCKSVVCTLRLAVSGCVHCTSRKWWYSPRTDALRLPTFLHVDSTQKHVRRVDSVRRRYSPRTDALRLPTFLHVDSTQKHEYDVGRSAGINVGYITGLEFGLEAGDKEFLMNQGAVAAVAFLDEWVSTHNPPLKEVPVQQTRN